MDWQLRCIFGADTMKINRTILNSSMYWGAIAHLWASHCMQCSLWAPYSLEELGTSSSRRNMLRTVLVCTNNTQCRPAAQKHCALRVSIATTTDGQTRPSILNNSDFSIYFQGVYPKKFSAIAQPWLPHRRLRHASILQKNESFVCPKYHSAVSTRDWVRLTRYYRAPVICILIKFLHLDTDNQTQKVCTSISGGDTGLNTEKDGTYIPFMKMHPLLSPPIIFDACFQFR